MPEGWTQLPTSNGVVSFGGPAGHGSRPIVTLAHEPFAPPTPEGFAWGVAAVRSWLPSEYDGFELVRARDELIDGRAAHLVTFRWHHAVGSLTQLLALVVAEPGLALQVDGVCLTELEASHLADLEHLVHSIGFRG